MDLSYILLLLTWIDEKPPLPNEWVRGIGFSEVKELVRMRALNSHFLLIDLHSSWHSANQIPISTLAYLQNSHSVSKFPSSFRRTRPVRKGVISSESSAPSFRSPEIRRPSSDRLFSGNGLLTNLSNSNSSLDLDSASTSSQSKATAELEMFIELLPSRMRKELRSHTEFRELIEVVLDLGRNPIARFPSGTGPFRKSLLETSQMTTDLAWTDLCIG
ncbi:hypothetical protein Csa_006822 [Cucumis sativus]|nr:hypothetical protein Csa_006822 [Cucumis sativus]